MHFPPFFCVCVCMCVGGGGGARGEPDFFLFLFEEETKNEYTNLCEGEKKSIKHSAMGN